MSNVLTGNDLGRLGSLQSAPTAHEIEKFRGSPVFRSITTKHVGNVEEITDEAHKLAHAMISVNEVKQALLLLMAASSMHVRDS
jgi:hypothetical protein